MAQISSEQQTLVRLAAIILSDFALVGWIVIASVKSGGQEIGLNGNSRKPALWLSLAAVAAAGIIFAVFLVYATMF